MEKQLKTMEQKMAENPNEIMENGLTREQNNKIDENAKAVSGFFSLIAFALALFSLIKIMSI